jgi:mRNA-degrading endonuclease toxin of MazEF toxin-antitoxin module
MDGWLPLIASSRGRSVRRPRREHVLRGTRLRPHESPISSESSGQKKPSRAVANQIRTIARHRASTRLGRLTDGELADLDRAVAIQLGLPIER